MTAILVASAIIGNLILVWLLIWHGWIGRLQWLSITTGLAVLVDCLAYFIHGFDHKLYEPLRVFVIYWMFPILELLCAWEAAWVGFKWLEWLMLVQVGLAVIGGLAHLHGDPWPIYRLEIFADWVDVAGIMLCVWMFRGEANYERTPQAPA
jgi:hypothetical protein